jgi:kynurenine formamidase
MAMTRTRIVLLTVATTTLLGAWTIAGQQPQRQGQPPNQQSFQSGVTREQFEKWMTELSNWGRWGKDDERGALNLITDAKRRQAAALVKTGTTVSLSSPIRRAKPNMTPGPPRPVNPTGAFTSHFLIQGDYLYERQELEYHGIALSHFDALCHVSWKGKNYNGFDFKEIVTPDGGCTKLTVNTAKDGIVTRGVFIDLPNTRVKPEDVAAWEKKTGIKISPGDALLLRTRKPGLTPIGFGGAGYEPSLIPLLKQRDVALIGADIPQEGGTIEGVPIPIHVFALVSLGVNLLDNLQLDALAETADRLKRWEFMLVVEPLRAENGAGAPINPVAIF